MESLSTEKGTTEKKSFSIERDALKSLERFAKSRKMSASAVVTLALRLFLEGEAERKKRERTYRAWLKTVHPADRATPEDVEMYRRKWRRR